MRVFHDFRCESRHVTEHYIERGVTSVRCPECDEPATRVFLTAPKLDWLGMAQGDSAGPEFIDRFEKVHNRETARQQKLLAEQGDYGAGYDPPPSISED